MNIKANHQRELDELIALRSLRDTLDADSYHEFVRYHIGLLDEEAADHALLSLFGVSLLEGDFNEAEFFHGLGAPMSWSSLAEVPEIYGDRPDIADFFLLAGCDSVRSRTYENKSGLHSAAAKGYIKLIQWFLGVGVPVDIGTGDDGDESPLCVAVECRQSDSIQALLSAGADPHRRGNHGISPIEIAERMAWYEGELLLIGAT